MRWRIPCRRGLRTHAPDNVRGSGRERDPPGPGVAVVDQRARGRLLPTVKTAGRSRCGVFVAITGTPGTGKTSVCEALSRRGYAIVDLEEVARREGCIVGRDESRGVDEVDIDRLQQRLRIPAKIAFLKGHYSHLLDANLAIVLRCRPGILRRRLEARGWPSEKVRENVEAEAIDVVTQEAAARVPFVFEIDTTDARPADTADAVLRILQGQTEGHEAGSVDWSHEVLSWY